MNDMRHVIAPKSDQLNSDDLIGGARTITIREVAIRPGTEQPVSIFFENDNNKPWKPCKSMSRVLVDAWGPDARAYVGRSATLYRDADVTWGGMKVGGIRVSHLSHIERDRTIALTATKGKKVVATIRALKDAPTGDPQQAGGEPSTGGQSRPRQSPAEWLGGYIEQIDAATDRDALVAVQADARNTKALDKLAKDHPDLHKRAVDAGTRRLAQLSADPETGEFIEDDPFGSAEDDR